MAETEPNKTIIGNIRTRFTDALKRANTETRRKAYAAYQAIAKGIRRNVSGNDLMTEEGDRLIARLYPKHIGRMIMFFYNPKWRETLPYYDRFPLVIPIEFYNDGFLGINLHYLPQAHRARLMDALYNTIIGTKYLDEKKTIQMSYQILKGASQTNLYKPCLKRYLYTHVRSKYYVVEPTDWQIALFLPTERFEKQSMTTVHTESLLKVGRSKSKRKKK